MLSRPGCIRPRSHDDPRQLENEIEREGRELMRRLMQDHLTLRARDEQAQSLAPLSRDRWSHAHPSPETVSGP